MCHWLIGVSALALDVPATGALDWVKLQRLRRRRTWRQTFIADC